MLGMAGSLLPPQEARADLGLSFDRIVITINAVRHQRVAGADGVFVQLDRVQPDHRGALAAVPLERRRALRPLAGHYRLVEDIALDERLERPYLHGHPPLDIADGAETRDDQHQERNDDPLKSHSIPLSNPQPGKSS